jgi:hypothetical protein
MFKALWNEKKVFTTNYPLVGPNASGTANMTVDLVKQGVVDTIDSLSIRLVGNIVQVNTTGGTASGLENPQGLITLANLVTAPQPAALVAINQISSRIAVLDQAVIQGAFDTLPAITEVNGGATLPIDVWQHYRFKRSGTKKSIDYALPMSKWNSAVLTLVCGTRNQLFVGGTGTPTWDMTGVQIEVYCDLDVDANPNEIHAFEMFEQDFNITAQNAAFLINQLPQGCFYDNLYFAAEDTTVSTGAVALSDGIINNISIQGGGRFWTQQGERNADYIRQRYTKPLFYDPNGGAHGLTGEYVFGLRDGLWSRALDATSTPIVISLDVNGPPSGHTYLVRLGGRKLVPGGVKKTIKGANGVKTVVGLPDA